MRSAGNASRSLRACVGAAWGSGSAREGRVAVRGGRRSSAGSELCGRRGMHRAACGRVSALRGGAEVLGKGASLCGGGRRCCEGEWVVRSAGNVSRSLRACVGAAWVIRSAREGREKMLGASGELRRGRHRRCVGVRRGCGGARKCSGRACRCAWAYVGAAWGSGSLRRGMGGEGGGFNSHSPQQHARTCIIIYTSALSTP